MMKPIVNSTIRAVVVICVLLFSLATIVYLIRYGQPGNSLHSSALSWSYTLIVFTLIALGVDKAIVVAVSTMTGSTLVKANNQ